MLQHQAQLTPGLRLEGKTGLVCVVARLRAGAPVTGREGFTAACSDLPMPVHALGGMKVDLLQTAIEHNAHGIAMPGGIW